MSERRVTYRAEIDGLRAIAVLAVVLYHADVPGFSGGFVGVDVFFVISGYLITQLVSGALMQGTFSFGRFYLRRAWRLLPALYVMLAATSVAAVLLLRPSSLVAYARSLLATLLMWSNVHFWHSTDYFAADARLQPLLHTWSLAVEEQYYLVFPLFALLIVPLGSRVFRLVLLAAALASFGAAQWASISHPPASFYLLPFRAWELLLGALVSTIPASAGQRLLQRSFLGMSARDGAAAVGFVAIAASIALLDDLSPVQGVHALAPTLGSAMIIFFANGDSLIGRALTNRVAVSIGLMSYSLYLWHQPIAVLTRVASGETDLGSQRWMVVGLSLFAGYVSWRFIEMPLRQPPNPSVRARRLGWAAVVTMGLFAFGSVATHTSLFTDWIYRARFSEGERKAYDLVIRNVPSTPIRDDGGCRFLRNRIDSGFVDRFDQCARQHGRARVLTGDSHALNIFRALYSADSSPFLVGVAQVGCRPDQAKRGCFYDDLLRFVTQRSASVSEVLYHQSGSYLLLDPRGRPDSDGAFKEDAPFILDSVGLERVTAFLDTLATSATVRWLGPFTEARVNLLALRDVREAVIPQEVVRRFTELDSMLALRAKRAAARWEYVSATEALQIGPSFLYSNGCLTFRDADHFSACGEALIGPRLVESLAPANGQRNQARPESANSARSAGRERP